jgi:hypothetical protein
MRVTVETLGITGASWPRTVGMEFPASPNLVEALVRLRRDHPATAVLFERDSDQPAGWFVVFRNGREVIGPVDRLADGDHLLITLPPSGG